MLRPPLSCKLSTPQVKEKCPLIIQRTSYRSLYYCCAQIKYKRSDNHCSVLSCVIILKKGSVWFSVRHQWNILQNEKLNVSHEGTNVSTFISTARLDWPADARHINSSCNKRNAKGIKGTFICVGTGLLPCREHVDDAMFLSVRILLIWCRFQGLWKFNRSFVQVRASIASEVWWIYWSLWLHGVGGQDVQCVAATSVRGLHFLSAHERNLIFFKLMPLIQSFAPVGSIFFFFLIWLSH